MAKDKPKDPSWMRAFDELPPEARAAYREAYYDRWDPRESLPFRRILKPGQLAANIRQQDLNLYHERQTEKLGGSFQGEEYVAPGVDPKRSIARSVADRAEARAKGRRWR